MTELKSFGRKRWAIADGYIPSWSNGPEPQMLSHETVCILNTGDTDANVEIMLYFTDRDPAGPYKLTVPPKRVLHQRFNYLKNPEPIPVGVDYGCVIESDTPIVVQHTRLDSRQAENALVSTIAFAAE